jgi:hypothetical protein
MDSLQLAVDAQPEHPVYPALTREQLEVLPPAMVLSLLEGRARQIRQEKDDPYRYGYEPEFWDVMDWAVAGRRAERPGQVLEVLILGGNRAAKTEFAAKRMIQGIVGNQEWECLMLHADEPASRAVQQKRSWKYLPPEWKPSSGKAKKTITTKLNYNELSGFTENAFALSNSSHGRFKFYSADVTSLEGMEFDSAWSDELIPLNWVDAVEFRLLTRAERTRRLALQLVPLLRAKEADPSLKFPRELLAGLYQGVHLITFTPILGFTPTCGRFLTGARTVRDVEAELLPYTAPDGTVGFRRVPRLQIGKEGHRLIGYFHTYDNKYGGNWEGMKAKLAHATERKIKERAYGVPEAAFDTRFPMFAPASHVRAENFTPKVATWYQIVDPCPGRNFSMIWVAVNALGESFIAREWPQEDDYIPGIGSPGPWAVPSTGTRKDGDRGPAQKPFGFGIKSYKREIARVERELYRLLHPGESAASRKRITVFKRIMDSRGGAAPTLAHESPKTLIDLFAETDDADQEDEEYLFDPSSKSLTGEGGNGGIMDGVEMVNDLLFYDETHATLDASGERMTFAGQAPRLYVCLRCTNTINALATWTGADGQKGACKDFADLPRYFAQAGPEYYPESNDRPRGGGTF